jgi:hypothetical protein
MRKDTRKNDRSQYVVENKKIEMKNEAKPSVNSHAENAHCRVETAHPPRHGRNASKGGWSPHQSQNRRRLGIQQENAE